MINDTTVSQFSARRAFKGCCPEKQALLSRLKLHVFKGVDDDVTKRTVDRLTQITFVPDYPGEDRDLP